MQSNELETIAASIKDARHRAYTLGQGNALRRVVEMVQADGLEGKTVVFLTHDEPPAAEAPQIEAPFGEPEVEAIAASNDAAHNDNAEQPGTPGREHHLASSPPGSSKGFLLDYLYPLGAKK